MEELSWVPAGAPCQVRMVLLTPLSPPELKDHPSCLRWGLRAVLLSVLLLWVQQSPPCKRSKRRWVCKQFQLSGCCISIASWAASVPAQGRDMSYPRRWSLLHTGSFLRLCCALAQGGRATFPHRGRVVQTCELSACKEASITCLFVSFLEVDEAGTDKGWMQTTPPRSPRFPPSESPVAGQGAWLRARLGVVIYCWPLMAINYYMPWRITVIAVELWLRGGSHAHHL